jgi:hypothetical protein
MATEDAATVAVRECQAETWADHDADGQHAHLGGACGLTDGLELGLELIAGDASSAVPVSQGIGLKWAPTWLAWEGWQFGLKTSTARVRSQETGRWRATRLNLTGIATRELSDTLAVHLNMGHYHSQPDQPVATVAAAAVNWTPSERWLLFAELLGQHRAPAVQQAGVRYWLLPETLGIDLTAGRSNATRDSRSWGIGLGWYGISF